MNIPKTMNKIEFYEVFKRYEDFFSVHDIIDQMATGSLPVYYDHYGDITQVNSSENIDDFASKLKGFDLKDALLDSIRLYKASNLDEIYKLSIILESRYYINDLFIYKKDIEDLIRMIKEPAREFIVPFSDDFKVYKLWDKVNRIWIEENASNEQMMYVLKRLFDAYNRSSDAKLNLDSVLADYKGHSHTSSTASEFMKDKKVYEYYIISKERVIYFDKEK